MFEPPADARDEISLRIQTLRNKAVHSHQEAEYHLKQAGGHSADATYFERMADEYAEILAALA